MAEENIARNANDCVKYIETNPFVPFKIRPNLKELDLSRKKLGPEGVAKLAEAIRPPNALEKLNLTFNNIGSKGAQFISEALKGSQTLTDLSFEDNGIDDVGVVFVSELVMSCPNLNHLNLRSNDIDEVEGLTKLAEALKYTTSLQTLEFGFNPIGPLVKHLVDGLKENNSLTDIKMYYNKLAPEGVIKIAEALENNRSLTNLELHNY